MPSEKRNRYSTANEFVALDSIDARTGTLGNMVFLYEAARGTVCVSGDAERFLTPVLYIDGHPYSMDDAEWQLLRNWVPHFQLNTPAGTLEGTYLAPPERRGFLVHLEFRATRECEITLSFDINWMSTSHVSDEHHHAEGVRRVGIHSAPGGIDTAYLGFRLVWPMFGLGLIMDKRANWHAGSGRVVLNKEQSELVATPKESIFCCGSVKDDLKMGESTSATLHVGLGLEACAGVASALDIYHEGWTRLLQKTLSWLDERKIECSGPAEPLVRRLNENAVYNYFFSQGVTIDTERMMVTSSRSPRFSQTGSYNDRDACLYSFPAILMIDPIQARRFLEYVFNVQIRNAGSKARYLDGVPLQPGMALDGLVTPLRALWAYVELTRDHTILFDSNVQSGVNRILETLETRCHDRYALYSTRLSPAGRPVTLRYLTYSNVLVWRALIDLSDMYHRIRDVEREHDVDMWARDVRASILDNCVVEGPYGRMFCFSTDAEGHHALGNEPEGSLLLLSHLEFCREDFPAFKNTKKWLQESAKDKSEQQRCVLEMANSLLAGNSEPLQHLSSATLDEGVACWSVDGDGKADSEPAWAACSGYMVYAMVRALEEHVSLPVLKKDTARKHGGSRITRTTIRPGIGWV